MKFLRSLSAGTVAGAVGTVVLDLATYGDMALRGRPSSKTPATLVKNVAAQAGVEALAAEGEVANNRRQGAGAMLGYVNGLGVGAVYGAFRASLGARAPRLLAALVAGGAAMALSDVPATKFGATDPATWGASGWLADAVPHAFYGLAVALTFDAFYPRD